MAHPLDAARLAHLAHDVGRLCASAREHEGRMVALVEDLDAAGHATSVDTLSRVRALCVEARDQRERAEGLLAVLRAPDDRAEGGGRLLPRILVVDDSSDARELAAAVLDAAGFETITASNGLEAVLLAHHTRPALVLMDVNMPVLDGIEATRLLKASAATRDLRVVAHTGRPKGDHGALPDLFVAVLSKPSSPEALLASVRRFAERDRDADAPAAQDGGR